MDLPIDKQEFDYIVTALWKCRKSEDKMNSSSWILHGYFERQKKLLGI